MSSSLSPEAAAKVRLHYDITYEFLAERNVLEAEEVDETFGHKDLREATERLSPSERRALYQRIRSQMQVLDKLMEGEPKQFDEPYVEHEDLVSGVRIPGYYETVN